MSLGDKLRQRRQEMGLTRPQLAAKICVTPSAIANYENGISTPKPDILISLINVLEVDANYIYSDYLGNNRISKIYDQALSTEEIDSIKKYRELSEEGKRLVRLIVNEEYTRTVARSRITFPCYLPGVRKLHTGFLMQEKLGSVRIKQMELPVGTDFCFQIQVDQYLPVFRKFDILALQKRRAGHNEMGLFYLNGIYYIRTLFQEKGECRLRALNVIDEDILVKETDEFRCIGTILGQVNGVLETP